jgi:hypothetical protein
MTSDPINKPLGDRRALLMSKIYAGVEPFTESVARFSELASALNMIMFPVDTTGVKVGLVVHVYAAPLPELPTHL